MAPVTIRAATGGLGPQPDENADDCNGSANHPHEHLQLRVLGVELAALSGQLRFLLGDQYIQLGLSLDSNLAMRLAAAMVCSS